MLVSCKVDVGAKVLRLFPPRGSFLAPFLASIPLTIDSECLPQNRAPRVDVLSSSRGRVSSIDSAPSTGSNDDNDSARDDDDNTASKGGPAGFSRSS